MPRKGENIYKRKDGRWEGRFIKGKDGEKTKYGYVYGPTYTDVKYKLQEKKAKEANRKNSGSNRNEVSFEYIASLWLTDTEAHVKESTWIKYHNLLSSYILPQIGQLKTYEIDYAALSQLCNELQKTGGKKQNGLSTKTVSDSLSVIKSVLRFASRLKYSVDMSALEVSAKTKSIAPKILSMQDEQLLIDYLVDSEEPAAIGVMICLFTGLRVGEICALTWSDISISAKRIYVHKTMQRIQTPGQEQKTAVLITEPKSQCSIRSIPISDVLMNYILKKKPGEGFVLTGSKERYMEPRSLQNHFKRILIACGLEYVNFHVLRHTFATRCVEVGFDIKSLSEILGHANVSITLNRYVHPSMELKQKNMDKLSAIFSVK